MNHFDTLITRYPALSVCADDIQKAENMMLKAYYAGGKILACGNGGSASDAAHIVGELMKGFLLKRPMNEETKKKFESVLGEEAEIFAKNLQCGIPAIALDSQHALFTAYANDVDADYVYAQQVFGYARENDLFIGISTSGNSKNVVNAAKAAKVLGIKSIALTGANESKLSAICDCTIRVPETETFMVQELHLPVYHYLCAEMEAEIFGKDKI
jgi:D-sedoheptulose 7-phosphate isomerase